MFSGIRRAFGALKVTEDATTITVEGVPADTIARDIAKIWNTNRINQFMFTRMGKNSFSFPKFFAPDVHYALQRIDGEKHARTRSRVINQILVGLQEDTWMKQIEAEHPPILDMHQLSELNLTMLEHQHNFLTIYNDRVPKYGLKGYLLAADPGSGKTLNGLAVTLCVKADLVLIVSPKNAVSRVWKATLQTNYKNPPTVWVAAEGTPYRGEKYLIVHYEAMGKALEAIGRASFHNAAVILDESHNLNEPGSLRSQLFVELCQRLKCENVLWMSGTPLKAMAYESIMILRTIDPLFTKDVEERFKKIYGRDVGRAVDILRNRLGLISYKVSAAKVINNVTSTRSVQVKIPNGTDYTLDKIREEMKSFIKERLAYYQTEMAKYTKIYNTCLAIYEETIVNPEQNRAFATYKSYIAVIRRGYDPEAHKVEAQYCNNFELKTIIPALPSKVERDEFRDCRSVIKYVQLKVFGEALGRILGKKRAQCHVEMVPHMGLEEIIRAAETKTVIFTSYVEVVKAISTYLKSKGFHPLEVYGETNANINGIIADFEKKEDINPLIATYQSLSTAVPLVMASTAIFVNQPFREFEMKQARARLDRLGQPSAVAFVNILLDTGEEPNISTRSQDILEWSKSAVDAMMGGEENKQAVEQTLDTYYTQNSNEAYVSLENRFDQTFELLLPTFLKD